jgi:hypothetical protein
MKAILYRDVIRNERQKSKPIIGVEDPKQSQYIALAMVYFTSVLMVSRYRDVIENNNQSNKSADTHSTGSASKTDATLKKKDNQAEFSESSSCSGTITRIFFLNKN